jgi:hypothetical protein
MSNGRETIMSFDNRRFNINGKEREHFFTALELAFNIDRKKTANGWSFDPFKGMILHKYDRANINKFMGSPSIETIGNMVWDWLIEIDESSMPHDDWDMDEDHDGHNGKGWRIYLEDWGRVNGDSSAICAIKPVYLWYGK